MGTNRSTALAVVALSFFFQNCGRSFNFVDPESKAQVLRDQSVFGGQGTYIFINKATKKLRALEDGVDQEGAIPITGPNGEAVIIISEPNIFGPGSGVIPVGAGMGQGQVSVENGVAQGPNWYVPPTVIITTTTKPNTDNSAALFGIFLGAIGAITSMGGGGGGDSYTNYQSYVPTPSSSNPTGGLDYGTAGGGVDMSTLPLCANVGNGKSVEANPLFMQGKCMSPLLIAFAEEADFRAFELTDPLRDGRWFDIAGRRSVPEPHTKLMISWLKKTSSMFITLPNEKGEVNGVDELFGNNTYGPDGTFAINGYEALRKHDSNGDGVITAQDEVFAKLRLWSDLDGNAIAEPHELWPLAKKGIELIDLNYDANYMEYDRFGNLTAMKSVVRDESGRLHLLFDLWFRVP